LADLEGRIALARAFDLGISADVVVRRSLRTLEHGKQPWTIGLGLLLSAGLAHASGDLGRASDFASSAGLRLRTSGMVYLAKLAAIYTRRLEGERAPSDLPTGKSSVRDPRAFARTFVPGFSSRGVGISEQNRQGER
jgi:hypothetical protein